MNYLETEKYFILDSKRIILDDKNSIITIPIFYNKNEVGKIKIEFADDTDTGLRKRIKDGILIITCCKFIEPSGRFTLEPMKIGEYKNSDVLIHMRTCLIDNQRIFEYTLFMTK